METEQGIRLDFHGAGDAEAAPLGPGSCRRRRGRGPRRSPLFPQRCFCRLKTRPRVGGCDVKMRRPWLKSAIRKRFLTPEVVAVLKNRVGRGRGWRGRRLSRPRQSRSAPDSGPGRGREAGLVRTRPGRLPDALGAAHGRAESGTGRGDRPCWRRPGPGAGGAGAAAQQARCRLPAPWECSGTGSTAGSTVA